MAGGDLTALTGVDADGERLEQRRLLEGHVIGDLLHGA